MSNFINVLKQTEIFFDMTHTQLELAAGLCEERKYDAGETIFPEGSTSDELYVIAKGEVEILVNPALVGARGEVGPGLSAITTLRRGQSFGEIALVDQGLRSATARAAQRDTRVLVLPSEKLIELCDTYPEFGYRLMYNLAADMAMKLRNTDLLVRAELIYGMKQKKG